MHEKSVEHVCGGRASDTYRRTLKVTARRAKVDVPGKSCGTHVTWSSSRMQVAVGWETIGGTCRHRTRHRNLMRGGVQQTLYEKMSQISLPHEQGMTS